MTTSTAINGETVYNTYKMGSRHLLRTVCLPNEASIFSKNGILKHGYSLSSQTPNQMELEDPNRFGVLALDYFRYIIANQQDKPSI